MAGLIYAERVKDTSASYNSSSFTLAGSPPSGSQAFSVVGNGNTCYYFAYDASNNWETQYQAYSSAPSLARGTPLASSNGGAQAVFSGSVTLELIVSAAAMSQFQYAALSGPNSQTSNYILALSDLGGIVLLPSSAVAAITVTIPPTSSVAWPTAYGSLGIVPSIYIINQNSTYNITVAQGTGVTLNRRDGAFGTGSRILGTNSEAQLKFYGSNSWDIAGSSLS